MASSDILAEYRHRILQENKLVKISGVPLPRNHTGFPASVEFPLSHLYFRLQALREIQTYVPEDIEGNVENYTFENGASDAGLTDILTTLSRSGEEFYRHELIYRELERPEPISAEDALHKYHRLVILGAPGSGKSTLLRYLARNTAANPNGLIPILVCLRDYVAYLSLKGTESLYDFAINHVTEGDFGLQEVLKTSERLLWLVDDLDGVYTFRDTVVPQIRKLPGNVILTSRPMGYHQVGLETFVHFEILSMTLEEVDRFLRDWFILLSRQAQETLDWVEERTRWLKTELSRRPYIQMLAGNPLLLTSLIVLSGEQRLKNFPDHRMDLYTYCVESLLDCWDKYLCTQERTHEKVLALLKKFSDDLVRQVILHSLYYVGWHLHISCYERQRNHHCAYTLLLETVGDCLAEQREEIDKDRKEIADVVLGFWERMGLLEVRSIENEEYVAFRHSMFREYAAAQYMAESCKKDFSRTWKFLSPRLHHYAWREPILMLAGLLDTEHLNRLARRLLRGVSVYERALHRDIRLAMRLVSEGTSSKPQFVKKIIRRLFRLSYEHTKKDLLTLAVIYVLGTTAILGTLYMARLPWAFILGISILWTLVWVAAFVTYEIPELQKFLAFPLRLWKHIPNRKLVIRLLGQCNHSGAISYLIETLRDNQEEVRQFAAEALGQIAEVEPVPELIQAMNDEGENVRKSAAFALGKIGAIPRLVQALNDDNGGVRNAAAEALKRIGKSQAIPNLALMLQNGKDYVRKASADTLRQISDARIILPLVQALTDNDKDVRLIAVEALGEIGKRENLHSRIQAVPGLVNTLKDSERQVRGGAAYALGQIGDPIVVPNLVEALKENKDYVKRTLMDALRRVITVQSVPYLVLALQDDDSDIRMIAVEALGQIGEHEDIHFRVQMLPAIVMVLNDSDMNVRKSAAEALGRLGQSKVVVPLIELLNDAEWRVRWAAAEALGKIGQRRAISPLITLLEDGNKYVRKAAIEALGKIGGVSVVSHLILALKSRHDYIQQAAAEALRRLGEAQTVPYLIQALRDEREHVRKDAENALKQIGDAQASPYLIQALQNNEDYVRKTAAEALGRIGEVDAVPYLILLLEDSNPIIRNTVAEALGLIGEVEATSALIQALQDTNDKVRGTVAKALGRIGSPEAVPVLLELLEDKSVNVRRSIVEALGRIGDSRSVPYLLETLKDQAWWVRWGSACALGRIGDILAVPHLIQALQEGNGTVRRAAAEALGQIGDIQAVQPLIKALSDSEWWVRWAASQALGNIGASQAVPTLIDVLKDENEQVRRSVVEALGEIREVQAVPELIHTLKDSDWDVRKAAAEALGSIRNAEAIPHLILAITERNEYVRRIASHALKQILDVRAVPYLIQALKDNNQNVRKAAADTLIQIGGVQAVSQLLQMLKYNDWVGREFAANILGSLAYTLDDRKILRRTARALWWRLTDHPAVAKTAFSALEQLANRLSILEVEAHPIKDI